MAGKKFDLSIILKLKDGATAGLKKLGGAMKVMGAAVVAFTALSIKTTIGFQREMNMVKALTGTTGGAFKKLNDKAKELGSTTQFTASEAASGMVFLAKAGWDASKVFDTIPGILNLAAAAQLDMGQSANIVTNIMGAYKLEAKDLTKVSDILTNAFAGSNTDLTELGSAFKNMGGSAKSAGWQLSEMAAAAGLLGGVGTPGAEAGTAIKKMAITMSKLASPTKTQAKIMKELGVDFFTSGGKIKSMTGILEELESSMDSGTDQLTMSASLFKLFGDRAGPKLELLLGIGSKGLSDFNKQLDINGTTSKTAAIQMEGLPGAWDSMKSAFEGVSLALGESPIGEAIEVGMRLAADSMRAFTKLMPSLIGDFIMIPQKISDSFTRMWLDIKQMGSEFAADWNKSWMEIWMAIPKPIRDWIESDKGAGTRDKAAPAADLNQLGGMAAVAAQRVEVLVRVAAAGGTDAVVEGASGADVKTEKETGSTLYNSGWGAAAKAYR